MSPYTWHHQGPRDPRGFTLNAHWSRDATGKRKSCIYARGVTSIVSNSLWPCGLWPARFLCKGGFSRQEYWSGLPYPSRALYFISCCPRCQFHWIPGTARGPVTQEAAPPPHLALTEADPSPLGPASGANPSGWPTCRGGDKTTTETQGQCSWGRGPKTFPPAVQRAGPAVLEGFLGSWGGLWLPAKERMLTAETQEKHLLFLYFDLFCSFFGIFFFSFSSPPPDHLCSCKFY